MNAPPPEPLIGAGKEAEGLRLAAVRGNRARVVRPELS
jgi:hypothetical protein